MRQERGSASVVFALLALFFFAMVLGVIEGGRKLANISRAEDLASEVARAAAATLDPRSLAQGDPRIDLSASGARAEALAVLELSGSSATLVNLRVSDGARRVTVVVRVDADSLIPGFDASGTGRHVAEVIDPVN